MREHPENPPSNNLGTGVTEEDMLAAIEASGYGLQSVAVDKIAVTAADVLRIARNVTDDPIRWRVQSQEEWSYVDSDSGDTRNLDALVSIDLTGRDSVDKPRAETPAETIRVHLDFLIECKQSELSFVFFMRRARAGDVPRVIGLPREWLSVKAGDHDFSVGMRVYDLLELYDLPLARQAATAISMSKTYRKGRSLELSGEEAFRGVALPLSKALRYYEGLTQSKEPKLYTRVRLVMPVAVVRAPMIGVRMEGGEPHMAVTPWVRLVRMDPGDDSPSLQFCQPVAIDVVHIDFLESYARLALESCVEVSQRLADFAVPCLTGEAIDPNFGEDEETLDEAEDSSLLEEPANRSLRPSMSDEEFMERWLEWFCQVHSPDSADGKKPRMTITRG